MTELVLARFRNPSVDARWQAVYAERIAAYRVAFAVLGNREQAEDVAHDALLKALESREEPDSMAAWVRTIVVRTALNAKRKPGSDPLNECAAKEHVDDVAVRITLQRLPSDQRALLALAIGEGLSYRELADAFGVPEGTIASRLSAAKAAFRREWEQ